MKYAPIAIFAYNRVDKLEKTLNALKKNEFAEYTEVFIFSDGAKNKDAQESVEKVRNFLKSFVGFKKVTIVEREKNYGLAESIITGVTDIIEKFGKIIVVEDDMLTSPYFLKYMNESLDMYSNDKNVACIHGYIYPVKEELPETFFIKGADCWGWATWKRAWDIFEPDGQKLLDELINRKLTKEFDFNSSYGYTHMLKEQVEGKNNSWAIRWYASAFLKDMLCLYPGESYVHNIGFDPEGTHCKDETAVFNVNLNVHKNSVMKIEPKENPDSKKKVEKFFNSLKPSFLERKKEKLKRFNEKYLRKIVRKKNKNDIGWFGDYNKWSDVVADSSGYDNEEIFQKVRTSLLKVKSGEVIYERDSVVFDRIQYSWPLLSGVMFAGVKSGGLIKILDFGGSLGSTYFQNKVFLDEINSVSWSIVEQKKFVDIGKQDFEDSRLKFFYDIKTCVTQENPNILLLSSVLQYIEKPYELLDDLLKHDFKYIIFDRTTFSSENRDILKLQVVPPSIYQASYPCWFLDLKKLITYFENNNYNVLEVFDALGGKTDDYDIRGVIMAKKDDI